MECPRCGKPSTEWQEGKWRCLSCGNYFLFRDDPTPLTVVNSNVSIAGDALYDLDTSNKRTPIPIKTPWIKLHTPQEDSEYASLESSQQTSSPGLFLVGAALCVSFFGVVSLILYSCSGSKAAVIVVMGFGVALAISSTWIFGDQVGLKNKLAVRLQYLTNQQVIVGYSVLCPLCKNEHMRISSDSPAPVGLTHCLSCGKQFFLSKKFVTIPLKTNKSASLQQGVIPVPVVTGISTSSTPMPPTPPPKMIECPFCYKEIPKDTVVIGINSCPYCKNQFEAEIGDRD